MRSPDGKNSTVPFAPKALKLGLENTFCRLFLTCLGLRPEEPHENISSTPVDNTWPRTLSRASNVQNANVVLPNPDPEVSDVILAKRQCVDDEDGAVILMGESGCKLRSAFEWPIREDERPVRIPSVPLGTHRVFRARRFLKRVKGRYPAVLGEPPLRTPPTNRHEKRQSRVERRPVNSRLTSGDDPEMISASLWWALG